MEKIRFVGESKIHIIEYNYIPFDVLEIRFIYDFIKQKPIDKFKELICLEFINPFEEIEIKSDLHAEYIERLIYEQVVVFKSEIFL
jgi:hypothetical protein